MTARITSSVVATLVAVTLLAQTPPSAAAASDTGDTTTAVLGFEAIDVPDNVATEVTDALRQRVASSKGFQLVQGKDLMEIKLVFSCSDEAAACMTQAGKSLGVARLIFGSVKQSGSDYVVRLKLLDVGRGSVENTTTETFAVRGSDATTLRALAPHWLSKLTGKGGSAGPAGGTLMISSNVSGATVALDGTAVGVTSQQPLGISDVAPGKHEIVVQKGGYESRRQQFTMGSGQALPLNLALAALPPGAPAPAPTEASGATLPSQRGGDVPGDEAPPMGMARPAFWIALVFTAASLGAATYYGLQVKQINKDLDGFRRFPCDSSPTHYCDSSGVSATSPGDASTMTKGFVSQKLDEGDRDRTYQIVSLCVGGAFALAGGFLYYKGYLDKEGGTGPKTADNHGLRIFPTGTASSGGVVAEFDF